MATYGKGVFVMLCLVIMNIFMAGLSTAMAIPRANTTIALTEGEPTSKTSCLMDRECGSGFYCHRGLCIISCKTQDVACLNGDKPEENPNPNPNSNSNENKNDTTISPTEGEPIGDASCLIDRECPLGSHCHRGRCIIGCKTGDVACINGDKPEEKPDDVDIEADDDDNDTSEEWEYVDDNEPINFEEYNYELDAQGKRWKKPKKPKCLAYWSRCDYDAQCCNKSCKWFLFHGYCIKFRK